MTYFIVLRQNLTTSLMCYYRQWLLPSFIQLICGSTGMDKLVLDLKFFCLIYKTRKFKWKCDMKSVRSHCLFRWYYTQVHTKCKFCANWIVDVWLRKAQGFSLDVSCFTLSWNCGLRPRLAGCGSQESGPDNHALSITGKEHVIKC